MTCTLALCLSALLTVTDGDTVRDGDLRVRLWGIDAPELREPGGKASRAALVAIIDGQPLSCDVMDIDRYDRTVARCDLPDGRDLSCAMIGAGAAKEWVKYSRGAYTGCKK
jgi:endonuclease YncB( thermonuclease family)